MPDLSDLSLSLTPALAFSLIGLPMPNQVITGDSWSEAEVQTLTLTLTLTLTR